jgi:hypothetical protein
MSIADVKVARFEKACSNRTKMVVCRGERSCSALRHWGLPAAWSKSESAVLFSFYHSIYYEYCRKF